MTPTTSHEPAFMKPDSTETGLTKREYFAAKILGHLVATLPNCNQANYQQMRQAAGKAVELADALVDALNGAR